MDTNYYNVVFVNERFTAKAKQIIFSKSRDFNIAKRVIPYSYHYYAQ